MLETFIINFKQKSMKRKFFLFSFFLLAISYSSLLAQEGKKVVDTKKHKVVMQVTVGDESMQNSIIRQVKNVKAALPNAEIEVVCHSGGLAMLVDEKCVVKDEIKELSGQMVTFAACENTMRREKVEKKDLVSQAISVPSGMAELIIKQDAGWAYVKAGH